MRLVVWLAIVLSAGFAWAFPERALNSDSGLDDNGLLPGNKEWIEMTDQAVLVRSAAHLLRAERANDEGVGGSGMSGSGLGPISPDPSPTPIMPIDKLVLLIVIELNLGRDEYEVISSVIVLSLQNVSQTFTNSTIIVDIDAEESNDTVTVILVHFESSSGEVDNPATMALFQFLSAEANLILFPQLEQYIISVSTRLDEPSSPPTASVNEVLTIWQWILIFVGVGILITAFPLACQVIHWRYSAAKRQRRKKKDVVSAWDYWQGKEIEQKGEGIEMQKVARAELIRKVSRITFQPRGPVQSHLLSIEELEELVSNPAAIITEYDSIDSNMVTMTEVPAGAEDKNRYKDVLPNPQTRVALFLKFGVLNSDYINANFIRGYQDKAKMYIATQGPLYWTVGDFWRMVWEQKSSLILITTGLEERGIAKCARYWPDDKIALNNVYEELEVIIKWRQTTRDYTTTIFLLKHTEKLVSREVTHFWFTNWPDHGVPSSTRPVINFLLQSQKYFKDMPGPAVVHCSAGIGRTGVFIGADIGMRQLEDTGEVDVLKIISTMRQDRGGMVQTRDQYLFLHKVLLDYARTQLKTSKAPSRLRAAVTVHTVPEEEEDEEEKEERDGPVGDGSLIERDDVPLISESK